MPIQNIIMLVVLGISIIASIATAIFTVKGQLIQPPLIATWQLKWAVVICFTYDFNIFYSLIIGWFFDYFN